MEKYVLMTVPLFAAVYMYYNTTKKDNDEQKEEIILSSEEKMSTPDEKEIKENDDKVESPVILQEYPIPEKIIYPFNKHYCKKPVQQI